MTGYNLYRMTVTVAVPHDDSTDTPITPIDLVDFGDECFILDMAQEELSLISRLSVFLDAGAVKERKQPTRRRKKHAQGH